MSVEMFYPITFLYLIHHNDIQAIDYTSILGEDDYGFDGQNDVREKVTYQFKDISSIKNWLKKNY